MWRHDHASGAESAAAAPPKQPIDLSGEWREQQEILIFSSFAYDAAYWETMEVLVGGN
ncbi:MAG: hypothetical protein VX542_01545 [Cyanobacteriota bacterium]|nr:hypothetical protein [Cyanobacteriota bacterium]